MEQETDDCPEEQSYRKMNIKIELEEAEPPLTEYLGTKINVKRIKEEATVQFVRTELDLSVKGEIMEEDWQDVDKQKCSQGAQTSAIVSSVNMPRDNAKVGDALGVKKEMTEIDIDPTVNWHGDTHCEIPQSNLSVARQVSEIKDDHSYQVLKEEIFGDGNRGYRKQHKVKRENFNLSRTLQSLKLEVHKERLMTICRVHLMRLDVFQCGLCDAVYTENRSMLQHLQNVHGYNPHSSLFMKYVNMNKNQKHAEGITELQSVAAMSTCTIVRGTSVDLNSIERGERLHLKKEHEETDLEIGPTVFQHMDSHYRTDQMGSNDAVQPTITDDQAVCSQVRNEASEVSQIDSASSRHAYNSLNKYLRKSGPASRLQCIPGFKSYNMCKICKKNFKYRQQLSRHNKKVHRIEEQERQSYKCDKCLKVYNSEKSLRYHNTLIHGTEAHKCTQCNKEFKCKLYLERHIQNIHDDVENYECNICKKICTTRAALYIHVSRFHRSRLAASKGKKMYRCDKCMKTLHCKRAFKTHCDDMHGTELYKCTECDKDYKCMRYLRSHISNVHSSRAHNYTCDYCQKSFWRKPTLRAHIIGFHGKRIHLCRICSKTFKCRDQLQQHNKRVHGNPQHKCEVCHRLFTTRPILKKHIKSAHGLDDWQYKLALRSQGVHGPRSVSTDMRAVVGTVMSAVVGSDIQHNVDTVKLESANAEFEHGSVVFQNNKVDSDDLVYI